MSFTTSLTAAEVEDFPDTPVIIIRLIKPDRLKQLGLSIGQIKSLINSTIKTPIVDYIKNEWISRKVPAHTGKLRRTLLASLNRANRYLNDFSETSPFRIELNTTGVSYAWFTTRMPKRMLRHPKPGVKQDPLGRNDPEAVNNWWSRMINNSRSKTKIMVRAFYRGVADLLKPLKRLKVISSPSSEARGLFRITNQ